MILGVLNKIEELRPQIALYVVCKMDFGGRSATKLSYTPKIKRIICEIDKNIRREYKKYGRSRKIFLRTPKTFYKLIKVSNYVKYVAIT